MSTVTEQLPRDPRTHVEAVQASEDGDESMLLAKLEALNRALASDEKAVVHVDNDEPSDAPEAGTSTSSSAAAAASTAAAAAPSRQEGGEAGAGQDGDRDSTGSGEASEPSSPGQNILWQWGEVLSNWDTFYRRKYRKLWELSVQGVPDAVRGKVWELMAQSKRQAVATTMMGFVAAKNTDQPAPYEELLQADSPHEKLIRRDIARTFPSHELFAEREGLGQEVLYNVIKAYSVYDPEVGYCQGSPFIVGLLLMHMPEEEAFHLLISLMRDYNLRGLFRPSMADLPLRLYQLNCLFEATYPKLHAHFDQLGVSTSMFASQWFLTLFATTLPLSAVFRILDLFLLEDLTLLFRAGLALLGDNHDYLLRQNMEGVLLFLTKRGGLYDRYTSEEKEAGLLDAIVEVKVAPKRLLKLERDYQTVKAAQAAEESELSRLRAECAELKERNRVLESQVERLEAETGVLAEKLLSTSVRLHKREEEMYDLKQSVADLQNSSIAWSESTSVEVDGGNEGEATGDVSAEDLCDDFGGAEDSGDSESDLPTTTSTPVRTTPLPSDGGLQSATYGSDALDASIAAEAVAAEVDESHH
eukprot:m.10993 g.10993  ORF g.10993 m.10993 type:complete len:586 (+) comp3904_c0_seq1:273-2030(+)